MGDKCLVNISKNRAGRETAFRCNGNNTMKDFTVLLVWYTV